MIGQLHANLKTANYKLFARCEMRRRLKPFRLISCLSAPGFEYSSANAMLPKPTGHSSFVSLERETINTFYAFANKGAAVRSQPRVKSESHDPGHTERFVTRPWSLASPLDEVNNGGSKRSGYEDEALAISPEVHAMHLGPALAELPLVY